MREVLRAGMAALAMASCANNLANYMPTPATTPTHEYTPPPLGAGNIRRDANGCPEGYPPASGPLDPEFPRLTARACLTRDFLNVEDLRAHCAARSMGILIHVGLDAPHWECDIADLSSTPQSE